MMMYMSNKEMKEYVKKRDKAVVEYFENNNFILFYAYLKKYYDEEYYNKFKSYSKTKRMIVVCNMIIKIDTIPERIKIAAREWLKANTKGM